MVTTGGIEAPEAVAAAPADDTGRERPWRGLGLLLATVVFLGWAAVVAVSLLGARTELAAARQLAEDGRTALFDADVHTAQQLLGTAGSAFARAHGRLSGPAMLPLRAVPGAGANLRAADALAAAGAPAAFAGAGVAGALAGLPGGAQALAPQDGAVPLEPLDEVAPALHRAQTQLAEAQALAAGAPDRGLLPPLAAARAELLPVLDQATDAVATAATLVDVLPAFLGADEPRRYFLGAQSPAELRGTGGLMGAYAILTIDEGRLDIGGFTPIHDLPTLTPDELAAPNADYAARYDRYGGAGFWQNLNMTPDFPSAATAIRTLYETVAGETVDGVVVVDPHTLAGLLTLTGPTRVPGGATVDADTVVAYLANEAYRAITDPEERKGLLGDVASGALDGFLRGNTGGSPVGAIRVLGDAAGSGHLLLHAADPEIQAAFEEAGVAGQLLDPDGDYLAAVVNNAANNKLDFYADRTIHYEVALGADGSATATAAVELANHAPVAGYPPYVLGPNVEGTVAGDNRSLLSVYCAAGCERTGFRRSLGDGSVRTETELGHPVFTTMVQLGSGEAERIELDWELDGAWERDGDGGVYRLTVQDQPTIRPTRLVLDVHLPDDSGVVSVTEGFNIDERRAQWSGHVAGTQVLEVRFGP